MTAALGVQKTQCLFSPQYNERRPLATNNQPGRRNTMLSFTLNGERRQSDHPLTVADLLERFGFDRRTVAVEVNRQVVARARHPEHGLADGDAVEVVTLVGGGSADGDVPEDKPLVV